jgi:hypothetical protein
VMAAVRRAWDFHTASVATIAKVEPFWNHE